jgi:hypothetical protein
MALMERVAMLLRANVNDMIDRAEDPEKMLKQLLLDMENQLLQVKTQVAIAIADQHLLEKNRQEQTDGAANWRAKALCQWSPVVYALWQPDTSHLVSTLTGNYTRTERLRQST